MRLLLTLACAAFALCAQAQSPTVNILTDYVQNKGRDPKDFLQEKLSRHKLVIYGEIHKRQISWDLLKRVIADPFFSVGTGVVFLEMSSDSQQKMDSFFSSPVMDTSILLDILRGVQDGGWDDRGMYEFVINLWYVNQRLPDGRKIKVVLTDMPRPYASLKSKGDYKRHFDKKDWDRDKIMADIVEQTMRSGDGRGGLFVVGAGHVYKARVAWGDLPPLATAGALLKERFSDNEVYTVLTHAPILSNYGALGGWVAGGTFDQAFARSGNRPVAFDLAGSPFGTERFDADPDIKTDAGAYADNYDGYIFFGPLKEEGPAYRLGELYTEDFVQELHRRASLKKDGRNWTQFGVKVKDVTLSDIQNYLKKEAQGKRWAGLPAN